MAAKISSASLIHLELEESAAGRHGIGKDPRRVTSLFEGNKEKLRAEHI